MSWHLECERGRQRWFYDPGAEADPDVEADRAEFTESVREENRNSADRIYRRLALKESGFDPENLRELPEDLVLPVDELGAAARVAVFRGLDFYSHLQAHDGHWPGDYGGPMFLMPGLVIMCHVTGHRLREEQKVEMIRYLRNHQRNDGGWGTHIESPSTMFGSSLNYCALRLLGVPRDDPAAVRGSEFIRQSGGAALSPSWAKFWLAVLGVLEWEAVNSVFPELWLLPKWLPLHPSRFWCHCRMVYLPMAYVYGHRVTAPDSKIVRELREELYNEPYESIPWSSLRSAVAPQDNYTEATLMLKTLTGIANLYEKVKIPFFRSKALQFVLDYVRAEDEQTNQVCIGPVNKVINMLVIWHASQQAPNDRALAREFRAHQSRVDDYLWLAEDGMKMSGYNGSQLWDTAFAAQMIAESGLGCYFRHTVELAHEYLDVTQVLEETPDREKWFRHTAKGAWPFSTNHHGWPISDCTSSGLKATLVLQHTGLIVREHLEKERLEDAINVILSFQNVDGGWATYENTRGPAWLELINPSEVFGDIMIDYSYVECSSACIQAMALFCEEYPDHERVPEMRIAIDRGVRFIRRKQRDDGSWYGSWAVCFTYAAWYVHEGLVAAGLSPQNEMMRKSCEFLVSKQKEDGSWGESFESSVTHEYVDHEDGQVVNTAWALLALMRAEYPDEHVIRQGIHFLLSRQLPTGDYDQEAISGVFNGNCMITYTAYRNVFPLWALSRFANYCERLEE